MTNLPLSVKTSQNLRSGKGKRHLLWCFDALRLSCSLAWSNCHMWSQHDHGQISWYFTSLAELLLIYIYIYMTYWLLIDRTYVSLIFGYHPFIPGFLPWGRRNPSRSFSSFIRCMHRGRHQQGWIFWAEKGPKRLDAKWVFVGDSLMCVLGAVFVCIMMYCILFVIMFWVGPVGSENCW